MGLDFELVAVVGDGAVKRVGEGAGKEGEEAGKCVEAAEEPVDSEDGAGAD